MPTTIINPIGVSAAQVVNQTLRPKNLKVAINGDSRTAKNSSSAVGFISNGWMPWLKFLTRQSFDFNVIDNYGVGGDTSTQMLARLPAMLAANDAGTIGILITTNDRGSANLTADQSIANLTEIRDRILNAGRICWFTAEWPRGDTVHTDEGLGTTQLQYMMEVSQWLRLQNQIPGVYVSDAWPRFASALSTLGYCQDGLLYDGLHQNQWGAYQQALAMKPIADFLFAPRNLLPSSNADLYNASNNPYGCLNANMLFGGSGGTLGPGGSGTMPASWVGSNNSVSGSPTRTYDTTTPDANGKFFLRCVIAGTAATSPNPALSICRQGSIAVTPGQTIRGVAEWELDSGFTGIKAVNLVLTWTGATGQSGDLYRDDDGGAWNNTISYAGVSATPVTTVPAGATACTFGLTVHLTQNVAPSATLRVRAMGLRIVAPP